MSDRYNYSSIHKVEGVKKPTVKIYFRNIIDSEPDLVVEVELLGMFEPNIMIKAMNLRTLLVLDEAMITFHLNKFGFAKVIK